MLEDKVLINDWHPVAKSEDLKEGKILQTQLLEEELVLWRLNNQVFAWQDLCIHRGARLSLGRVENDGLVCPYHGWVYNNHGQCVKMPAHPEQRPPSKAKVTTYLVQEKYDVIWVALGSQTKGIPNFPEWANSQYRKLLCGPYFYNASAPRVLENFLDIGHFPFVHEGILGDREHAEISDYEVTVDSNGITANNIRVWQPNPDGSGQGSTVTYRFHVFRPLTGYFTKASQGTNFAILFVVTPVKEFESLCWIWIAMDYGHEIKEEKLRSFQDEIVFQDIRIVESQRPERLPLDLQAELHLLSDRTAITYRKWLTELGLTFGTA